MDFSFNTEGATVAKTTASILTFIPSCALHFAWGLASMEGRLSGSLPASMALAFTGQAVLFCLLAAPDHFSLLPFIFPSDLLVPNDF